jgi:hypothetical protein
LTDRQNRHRELSRKKLNDNTAERSKLATTTSKRFGRTVFGCSYAAVKVPTGDRAGLPACLLGCCSESGHGVRIGRGVIPAAAIIAIASKEGCYELEIFGILATYGNHF